MTNLTWIPAQDDFETTLAASWNGWVGSMLVFNIPEWTLPAWEHTFVVVEPWTDNMQVAEISGWTESPKALTVSNVGIEKANGVMYTAKMHPANSVVRISNNFAFWKEIKEAVNSKADPSIVWDYSFSWNEISVTGDVAQFTPSGADITISTSWDMKFKDKNIWPVTLSQIIRPAQSWSAIEVMSEDDFQQIDSPDVNTWYFRYNTDNVLTKMYFNGCDCNFWWKADIHNQSEKLCIETNDEIVIADSADNYENKRVKYSKIYDKLLPPRADILVVGWGWAWWAMYGCAWWAWWGGWVVELSNYLLCDNSYCVVVGNWWTKVYNWDWWNWWTSCFWTITASGWCGWIWGGVWWTSWNWYNGTGSDRSYYAGGWWGSNWPAWNGSWCNWWNWWLWYISYISWSKQSYAWGWAWWGCKANGIAYDWWWSGTNSDAIWCGWWWWGKGAECGWCWWNWWNWVVIVRYWQNWWCGINCATWWTVTCCNWYVIHTFTSDWTFCIIN